MNIAIIGSSHLGHLGLVTGVCLADLELHITCAHEDEARGKPLAAGERLLEPAAGRYCRLSRLLLAPDTALAETAP